jgi:hypothetical protein
LGFEEDMFSKKIDILGGGIFQKHITAKTTRITFRFTASISPKWYLDRTKDLLTIGKFLSADANSFKGWTGGW